MDKKLGLIAAMKDFFGYKQDQKLPAFMVEVKAAIADPADRAFYIAGLEANGYAIQVEA
jgi:hypothetical protein